VEEQSYKFGLNIETRSNLETLPPSATRSVYVVFALARPLLVTRSGRMRSGLDGSIWSSLLRIRASYSD
jgi:hypothetical protein